MLAFSNDVYFGIIGDYTRHYWWFAVLFTAGIPLILIVLRNFPSLVDRLIILLLITALGLMGWQLYILRFAGILWIAPLFACLCGLQALLFLFKLRRPTPFGFRLAATPMAVTGATVLFCSLFLLPAVEVILGKLPAHIAYAGLLPIPTLTALTGLLLMVTGRLSRILYIIPALLLLAEGLQSYLLGNLPDVFLAGLGLLATLLGLFRNPPMAEGRPLDDYPPD